jgi:anti-anti-sigma factor
MSQPNHKLLDVAEIDGATVVRFVDHKVLNDHKMEIMAEELFRLAATLVGHNLRLDFGNVEYLQSSVLGKLVMLQKALSATGGKLTLCNINPVVYKVFTVTKLAKFFTIEPSPRDVEPGGDKSE